MKARFFPLLLIILFFCIWEDSYSQSINTQANSTNKKTYNSFTDHFEWVDSKRNDIHEINFIAGYSFHSTRGFWGKIPDATLQVYTLRYNRKLFTYNDKHLIEYVGELNLAVDYELSDTQRFNAASFSGWGFRPLGFQFNFGADNIVQPFFKSSTGFMFFPKRYPNNRGSKFNFTLELGGGLEFVVAKNLSLSMGYKYHHMSNGGFGNINPGTDSNIFYTGFTIF